MMPVESFRIGLFAAGAILILIALLTGRFTSGPAPAGPRRGLQVGIAAAGVAVIVWTAWPYLVRHRAPAAPPPAAAIAPTTSPAAASSQLDAVGLASQQLAACPLATAPSVPDGSTANRAQMTAARTAFQGYDAATNAYTKCVDSAVDRLQSELRGKVPPAELQRLQNFGTSAHNTAVDQDQAVADKFNGQIRIFKARHP
jgi:hypothetical protein